MMTLTSRIIAGFLITLLISVSPLLAGIVVRSELTQEKTALQGEVYQGILTISNDGEEIHQAKAYQTDYLFNSLGQSFYNDPGTHGRSNAGWIEFSPKQVSVPPGGEAVISYKVAVPDTLNLTGTYWSMIMIEEVSVTAGDPVQERTIGISTKIRYGVQMVTHIGKSGNPDLNFTDVQLLAGEAGPYLQVDLENNGTRWSKPVLWVDIVGSEGKRLERRESEEKRIFPGTSVRHKIDLSDVPYGSYQTLIIADGGENAMIGIQRNLNILRK